MLSYVLYALVPSLVAVSLVFDRCFWQRPFSTVASDPSLVDLWGAISFGWAPQSGALSYLVGAVRTSCVRVGSFRPHEAGGLWANNFH